MKHVDSRSHLNRGIRGPEGCHLLISNCGFGCLTGSVLGRNPLGIFEAENDNVTEICVKKNISLICFSNMKYIYSGQISELSVVLVSWCQIPDFRKI